MKNIFFKLVFLIALIALSACFQKSHTEVEASPANIEAASALSNQSIEHAFKNKKSDIFVEGSGVVKKLLPDDNKGSRHQKFLVTISAEQTLLFAHNIDLAPRIDDLQVGDAITFKGEYVYNPKGGVMHWTHRDPSGEKRGGWLKHNGKVYE